MHQHDYHHFLNLGVVLTAVAIMATSRVGRDGMLDDCAKYAVEPSRKAKLEQQLADKKAQLQSTETLGAHARKRLYQLQHECQEGTWLVDVERHHTVTYCLAVTQHKSYLTSDAMRMYCCEIYYYHTNL
eukprot:m.44142 g.44142  ORF g.44142 m.44142 type:complete len:129 (+) comp10821_c0_seq3:24-410(+)